MFPEWFLNLPWNIFDTIISLTELLFVYVPAIAFFMYYKIHSLSICPIDVTDNGTKLLIHNKTNKSIIITDMQFINSKNSSFEKPCIMRNSTVTQLKPDDCMEVVINYSKNRPGKHKFKVIVNYNRRKKKVKVTA